MLKQLLVACAALAFATQASSQSIIEKAKQQREAEQKQKQQKAGAGQSAPPRAGGSLKQKRHDTCTRQVDGKKLSGDARTRAFDQCMAGKT